jgi:hypothetical protein
MLMTFPCPVTKSDGKTEVKATLRWVGYPCSVVDQSVGLGTGVDVKLTFAGSSSDVCFLMRMYAVFLQMGYTLKLCPCYII